jgi:hypothetical protein
VKTSDFDWKAGRVTWWSLDRVDATRPAVEQASELDEDLAQVEFPADLILDIGWYPSWSKDGAFGVQLVKSQSWDAPLRRETCRTFDALHAAVTRCVADAMRIADQEA